MIKHTLKDMCRKHTLLWSSLCIYLFWFLIAQLYAQLLPALAAYAKAVRPCLSAALENETSVKRLQSCSIL
jgi:hypothetical protein